MVTVYFLFILLLFSFISVNLDKNKYIERDIYYKCIDFLKKDRQTFNVSGIPIEDTAGNRVFIPSKYVDEFFSCMEKK